MDFGPQLRRTGGLWHGQFKAMGGPCEILIDNDHQKTAANAFRCAVDEALRIEKKFSRYRDDNIIYTINQAGGEAVEVDDETARLLDYAQTCYQLSEGRFDITSGVLRKVWKFDGGNNVPDPEQVNAVLSKVGWSKVQWHKPFIRLKPGMELDFGGIGKEYAVDHAAKLLCRINAAVLINFGGDISVPGPRADGSPWAIGIENPHTSSQSPTRSVSLSQGAIATSGDARRYLLKDGHRYGHILDPITGWPVPDAPRSVTVVAPTCLEAGMLSTFAILHGGGAEEFLQAQDVPFWMAR